MFPKSLALRAWRVDAGAGELLVFSEAAVLPRDGLVEVHSAGSNAATLATYPRLSRLPRPSRSGIRSVTLAHPALSASVVEVPAVPLEVRVRRLGADRLTVGVDSLPLSGPLRDVYLEIDYQGDTGMAFIDGRLVDDHFYHGPPRTIGLKRFAADLERNEEGMYFFFRPTPREPPYLRDLPGDAVPELEDARTRVRIDGVKVVPEHQFVLAF